MCFRLYCELLVLGFLPHCRKVFPTSRKQTVLCSGSVLWLHCSAIIANDALQEDYFLVSWNFVYCKCTQHFKVLIAWF